MRELEAIVQQFQWNDLSVTKIPFDSSHHQWLCQQPISFQFKVFKKLIFNCVRNQIIERSSGDLFSEDLIKSYSHFITKIQKFHCKSFTKILEFIMTFIIEFFFEQIEFYSQNPCMQTLQIFLDRLVQFYLWMQYFTPINIWRYVQNLFVKSIDPSMIVKILVDEVNFIRKSLNHLETMQQLSKCLHLLLLDKSPHKNESYKFDNDQINQYFDKSIFETNYFADDEIRCFFNFRDVIQPYYVESMRIHFSSFGQISDQNPVDFIHQMAQIINQEQDLFLLTFGSLEQFPSVTKQLETVLLQNIHRILEDNAFPQWVREKNAALISQTFKLYSFQFDEFVESFTRIFYEHGHRIVKKAPEIIRFTDEWLDMVKYCPSKFTGILSKCFVEFMNQSEEILTVIAEYMNVCLKQNSEEFVLKQCVNLAQYFNDKDLFRQIYWMHLTKRLSSGKYDIDNEMNVISCFKSSFGCQYTSKFEGTLRDAEKKRDYVNDLFSVQILSQAFWPLTGLIIQPKYPLDVINLMKTYEQTHKNQFFQKLTWNCLMGTVELRATIKKKIFLFDVAPIQAIILLNFSSTLESICKDNQIDENVAKRVLHSLACVKNNILKKTGDLKKINASDTFSLNDDFTSSKKRLSFPLPSFENMDKIKQNIDIDRTFAIDAAIVRTMKARKTMQHSELIIQIHTQLQQYFKPNLPQIKKRIEALIDREYLERCETQHNVYNYLA